jgi:hypothetical protein
VFTFLLALFQEQPSAHAVAAAYNDGTAFASSAVATTAGQSLFGFFFQLFFDFRILRNMGVV